MHYGLAYLFFSFSIIVFSITNWLRGIRKNKLEFLGLLCLLKCQCLLSASKKVLVQMGSMVSQGGLRQHTARFMDCCGIVLAILTYFAPPLCLLLVVESILIQSVNLIVHLLSGSLEISHKQIFFPPVDTIKLAVVFRASYPQNDYLLVPDREKVALFS